MKLKVKETGKVINAFCVGFRLVKNGTYESEKEEICFSSFDEEEDGKIYRKSELEPVEESVAPDTKEGRVYEFVKDGFSQLLPDILKSRPAEDEITDAFETVSNAAVIFVEGLEKIKL